MHKLASVSFFLLAIANSNGAKSQVKRKIEDIICHPDKVVDLGTEVVTKYEEDDFHIWCKPGDGFEGIGLHVKSNILQIDTNVNMTKGELEILNNSLWFALRVKLHYEYLWIPPKYKWSVDVTVDDKRIIKNRYIGEASFLASLTFVTVMAYGPSHWNFTEPSDGCKDNADAEKSTTARPLSALTTPTASTNGSLTPQDRMILYTVIGFLLPPITLGIAVAVLYGVKHKNPIHRKTLSAGKDNELEHRGAVGAGPQSLNQDLWIVSRD